MISQEILTKEIVANMMQEEEAVRYSSCHYSKYNFKEQVIILIDYLKR